MKRILLLATIAACLICGCGGNKQETKAFENADTIAVKVVSVSSLKLTGSLNATGLVATENEAKYSFKIGGVISRVLVDEGQFFKKGQLLAVLNSTEIAAGVAQSGLNVEKALRDYNRARNLYRDSVFTREQLENSKTALNVAEEGKKAVMFNERYSRIYAASDGFVSKKMANTGEVVAPGAAVLIINETRHNNNYLLKIGLTDKEWATVNIGQKATVILDGYPGKQFDASVFRKSQAADRGIGAFQAELKLDLKDTKAAVGMFGKAKIYTGRDQQVTSIPYDALVEADGNKGFVFLLAMPGKVKKTPVEIISFDNQLVYLKEGLSAAEQVVISNSAYLSEQSTVKVIR